MAASKASMGIGSRPEPAIAPSITELTIAPACLAAASMSNSRCSLAFCSTALIRRSESWRPSAICIFSTVR